MDLKTHKKIDKRFSGEVVDLKDGYSKVLLKCERFMSADEEGLVHGGFTFSAADFAAMCAINDPYVVLVGADVKFLAPVVVNDEVIFEANVIDKEKSRAKVEVLGRVGDKEVFRGIFKTYTLNKHILKH